MQSTNQKLNNASVVRIGPKHQVTIPKEAFKSLNLEPGDFLETRVKKGKIVMSPRQLTAKSSVPRLTKKEHNLAFLVRDKINKIQTDIINSNGLDDDEADLAVKIGLLDEDQAWWWKEHWQKGEREAEKDIKEGRVKSFDSVEALIEDLNKPD